MKFLKLCTAAALGVGVVAALASPASAIVGGTEATQPYSFMGSLQRPDSPRPDGHVCGVELIAPQWVLTASHCARTPNLAPVGTPIGWHVRMGSLSASSGGQVADVDRFYRLAVERQGLFGDDLALLHLKTPIHGRTIPLATSAPKPGTPVRIMGWGVTCDQNRPACYPDRMRQADTVIQPDADCASLGLVHGQELCLGAADGSVGATDLDSGGPALIKQNGQWALAGTTESGSSHTPSIYETVSIRRAWIMGIVDGTNVPPEVPMPSLAGDVQLNGCIASVVRTPDAEPQDPALLLTNGHCVQGTRPAVGSALVDQPAGFSFDIADHDGYPRTSAKVTRLVYATMTGTDVALYRVDKTYAQLAAAHAKVFTLGTKPMLANEKVDVLGGAYRQPCTVAAVVPHLREGGYQLDNAVRTPRTDKCILGPGYSGSAMIAPDGNTVVGIHNTSNQGNGAACSDGNPCEVGADGKVTSVPNAAYGEQVDMIPGCFDKGSVLDLTKPGCTLTK